MRFSNYHTHSFFCDGSGTPAEFCAAAVSLGFRSLGFSSHAPFPIESSWNMSESSVDEYRKLVTEAKAAFAGDLEVYLGMEADFFQGTAAPDDDRIKSYGLDYVIGSVHYLTSPAGRLFTIDDTVDNLAEVFEEDYGCDGRRLIEDYYDAVDAMLSGTRFDILGHLDLAKKNNAPLGIFDEDAGWYRERVMATIGLVAKNGCIVEANTGGMARKRTEAPYPADWMLKELHGRKVPITLDSDAHRPEHLDFAFEATAGRIRDAGYRSLAMLERGHWVEVELGPS